MNVGQIGNERNFGRVNYTITAFIFNKPNIGSSGGSACLGSRYHNETQNWSSRYCRYLTFHLPTMKRLQS